MNHDDFCRTVDAISELLKRKNKSYGSSALSKSGYFSDGDPVVKVKVRIDDKINRIKSGNMDFEGYADNVADLAGYLIILLVLLSEEENGA